MTPDILQLLSGVSNRIAQNLDEYGKSPDRFGLIHADLRLANILVEEDKIKIIDFDDCGYSWYMHDLAAATSFIEHLPETPLYIDAWKKGYRKILPLSKEDEEIADTLIMMRRLQLLAWLTSHQDSTPVAELSVGYLDGTVSLAKRYLEQEVS
jgi:Ser/Thr protein kinase RdoA (MazF antagonist)